MNLIRGSGSTGLKGIAPCQGSQTFLAVLASQKLAKSIRPLAGFYTTADRKRFLTSKGLVPRHDSTNTDTYYFSKIVFVMSLIPRLESDYNPNIKSRIESKPLMCSVLNRNTWDHACSRGRLKTCRVEDLNKN